MPTDKAQKLKEIMTLLSDSLTRKDFEAAFAQVVQFVKDNTERSKKDAEALVRAVNTAIERIESKAEEERIKTTNAISRKAEDAISNAQFRVEALVAEAEKKIDEIEDGMDGRDGEDADEEEIVAKVLERIPAPVIPMQDLTEIESKIKALDERLSNVRTAPFIGPARGIQLKVNGVKQGMVSELNIVGSGVAMSKVNGLPTVTIEDNSLINAIIFG